MRMEFYGCLVRRIILNLKQSPLPQGTVIIYRQGGEAQWFLERSHSFQGEKEEKGWSSLTECRKGSQKITANVGDYRNTAELYGRIRRTQPKSTDDPPPLLLPFPTPKPRSLTYTKQIIMIIKKIEIHENNYNMSQNIQPIRIQGRRYIRQYYTQPFHCAPQSTRRNVNVENLILYF